MNYRTTGVDPSLAGAKTTLPAHLPSGRPALFELHRQGAPTVIELGTLQKPLCAKPVPLLVLVQKHNLAGAFGSDGCRPVAGTVICGTSTIRRPNPAGLSCAWSGEARLTKLAASTAIRTLFDTLSMCVPFQPEATPDARHNQSEFDQVYVRERDSEGRAIVPPTAARTYCSAGQTKFLMRELNNRGSLQSMPPVGWVVSWSPGMAL